MAIMQPDSLNFSENKPYRHVALALGYYDYWINVGIARFAREHHWRIDKVSAVPQGLSPQQYDGVICLLTPETPSFMLDFVRMAEVPVVDLVDEHRELAVHRVIYDNFAIGELAAKHFLERGFERFIYYQMSHAQVELERKRGFETRINRHGFELVSFDLAASMIDCTNRENRIDWLKNQLSKLKFPVAAMSQCDANTQELLTLAPPVIFFCLTFFPDFRNFLEVLIGTSNTKIPLFNLLFLLLVMLITGLFLWLKMICFYLFRKMTKNK